jgi:aminopeptidase N
VVYIQGGNFLDDTRRVMGSTAFWAGMRDYLATYRFGIGSTKALLDTLDRHTPLSLVPRYEPRFPGLY